MAQTPDQERNFAQGRTEAGMSWREALLTFCMFSVLVAAITGYILLWIALTAPRAKAGAGPAEKVTLTCPLALGIQEAAKTRMVYLDGVFDETDNIVEKATLAVEINGLDGLEAQMIVWRLVNCTPPQ